MKNLVFFGSLRSPELLKIVIGKDLKHLNIYEAKILNSKLFKVKNENFPYLKYSNLIKDLIQCTYIEGFTVEDFERILFYESVEYKLSKITICLGDKNKETFYFELIKKHKTNKLWVFDKWKIKYEKFTCIAAKDWMTLFSQYKNTPNEAEIYWQEILLKASKKINQ